jgi:PadR family transcriptional regulator, regulatory protein AphA
MNVRTLCLGILSFQEASGYEIKKEIEEGLFRNFIDASFGSIYPALTQLHSEGLVTVRAEEQAGRPDKKVYAITESGRKALAEGFNQPPGKDKCKSEFMFAMLFQHLLTPGQVDLAIRKQLHDVRENLNRIALCKLKGPSSPGSEFIMGYGEAILTASAKYLEEHVSKTQPAKVEAAE